VYLVEADDGSLALVDTGFGSSSDAILEEVRAHGGTLTAILLTHAHTDHAGAAASIRRATGARVFLGQGDCSEHGGRMVLHPAVGRTHVIRRLTGRAHRAPNTDAVVDVPLIGEQEVLAGIRAIPVAGHTPGSYCFVVPRLGAAFVGDLVISHGGELTRSMQLANGDDLQYLDSIRRFAAIAPGIGLPGHGNPVMEGFGVALRGLAELPRRRGRAVSLERAKRLMSLSRGMARRRPPSRTKGNPGSSPGTER
jgi:glyoxylase-like metal-dependent hydrolase (beta-lactamase superfamily II)